MICHVCLIHESVSSNISAQHQLLRSCHSCTTFVLRPIGRWTYLTNQKRHCAHRLAQDGRMRCAIEEYSVVSSTRIVCEVLLSLLCNAWMNDSVSKVRKYPTPMAAPRHVCPLLRHWADLNRTWYLIFVGQCLSESSSRDQETNPFIGTATQELQDHSTLIERNL